VHSSDVMINAEKPRGRAHRAAQRLTLLAVLGLTTAVGIACGVSESDEVQLGRQNAQQVNAQLRLVQDPVVNEYVRELGLSIARTTPRADLDWRFFVIDSREVNAFALPGGFIYVNRGLIERAQHLDELAGALAHEIGHVVRRHSVSQMEKQNGANVAVGLGCTLTRLCNSDVARAAIQVGGAALFARYSRHDEAEADSEAVVNVINNNMQDVEVFLNQSKMVQRLGTVGSTLKVSRTLPGAAGLLGRRRDSTSASGRKPDTKQGVMQRAW